jgi:hypothetical protein
LKKLIYFVEQGSVWTFLIYIKIVDTLNKILWTQALYAFIKSPFWCLTKFQKWFSWITRDNKNLLKFKIINDLWIKIKWMKRGIQCLGVHISIILWTIIIFVSLKVLHVCLWDTKFRTFAIVKGSIRDELAN